LTPSTGPGGSTSVLLERSEEKGDTGRVSYAFGGALGEAAAWTEAGGATLAAEFLLSSALTTPRFSRKNTFSLGEAPVLPLGDMAEPSPSISSGVGPVGPGSLSGGASQGGVERGNQSGVSAASPEGAPAGEPVSAVASAPAGAPTTTSQEARISCATRVAGGLGGSSVGHILAAAPIYTPPTVAGLPADPAPPVPNVWTAAFETRITLHPASRRRLRPARGRAAPPRPGHVRDCPSGMRGDGPSNKFTLLGISTKFTDGNGGIGDGTARVVSPFLRSVGQDMERVLTNM